MGSKKKAKEKKKDFVKQKLKVGKTALRNANHTDTSFRVKSINVPLQNLNPNLSLEDELLKNISLTKHASHQVRKEAVVSMQKILAMKKEMPALMKPLILAVSKLIIDNSNEVRSEALNVFKNQCIKQVNLQLNYNLTLLYIQSAMTHIDSSIRNDSTKFLEALISTNGILFLNYIVDNNWVKLLKSFFSLLNWPLNHETITLNVNVGRSSNSKAAKSKIRHVKVLNQLVSYGIFGINALSMANSKDSVNFFSIKEGQDSDNPVQGIHTLTIKYMFPSIPSAFQHLQLFSRNTFDDTSSVRSEDPLSRRKMFIDIFANNVIRELQILVKEGGEIGKISKVLLTSVTDAMNDENDYRINIGSQALF